MIVGVPRVPPAAIRRPRIEAILDEGAPLCVLRSPGGTGKTTVLAQWVERAAGEGETLVWVTVDLQTQTRTGFWVRFLTHLHHGGRLDDASFYRELVTATDSHQQIPDALSRVMAAVGPVLLVIDNYAATAGEFWNDVSRDILALLQRMSTVRCVVAGRFQTLLEGPTAVAAVGARVLDETVMRLTDEEARDVAAQSGVVLDADGLAALIDHTRSRSIQDLRYALHMLQRRLDAAPAAPLGLVTAADVDESVPAQVRDDLSARLGDPDVLKFLGATALAPYTDRALSETLAAALELTADGGSLLTELESEGLGYWSGADGREAEFRLSDHVRAVAAAQFAAKHPRLTADLLRRIARWLIAHHDEVTGAIEYALRAGDLDFADNLLMRAIPLLPDDPRYVGRLLARVPASKVRAYPSLSLYYGLYLNTRRATQLRAQQFFLAAARMSRARAPARSHAERAILLGLESGAWRLVGNSRQMLERARRAMHEFTAASEVAEPAPGDDLDLTVAAVLNQVSISLFAGDDLTASRQACDALSTIAAERGWAHYANVSACGRAMLAVAEGRLDDARAELGSVRLDAWPRPWLNGYVGAFRNIAQAWIHIDDGDPEAALEELALLDPHFDTIEHWAHIASARAVAEAMLGRATEAEARLSQARRSRSHLATLPSTRGQLAWTLRLVQLASGTARSAFGRRVRGRAAAMDLALRAYASAVHQAEDDAVALLAQAQAETRSPLHEALTLVVGIVVAHRSRAGLEIGRFASELVVLVGSTGLHWPVMLLADGERCAALAALETDSASPEAAVLTKAFASVSPVVDERLWEQAPMPSLTARELDVLRELAGTGSRAEIAARLHVSVNTIKAQLRSAYRKLGVRTREEALTRAVALGLLVEPESDQRASGT